LAFFNAIYGDRQTCIRHVFASSILLLLLLTGCGFKAGSSSGSSSGTVTAGAWSPSATPVDSGSLFDTNPQIAVQPNGDVSTGFSVTAIWLKQVDLDPYDTLPAVYHLLARRGTNNSGNISWVSSESACPFGNPDPTGPDGICLIDTGSRSYGASAPKVSMADNGNAIVVWEQNDGTAQRVYARRFSGTSWGAIQQLNNSSDFTPFNASAPAIAVRPNGTNGDAMAVWSQYYQTDWTTVLDTGAPYDSVRSMAVYNGNLYAGMGDNTDGDGDVYVYNPGGGTWDNIHDNGAPYDQVDSMAVYSGKLYVGYGDSAAGDGDVESYDVTTDTWTTVFDSSTYESVRSMAVYNNYLYLGLGNGDGHGDVKRCTVTTTIFCNTTTDWVTVLDHGTGTFEEVPAMAVYNGKLYIGLGNTAGTDAVVKNCTLCDGSDWNTSLTAGSPYDAVRSMAVHNTCLYVGLGDTVDTGDGNGDVMRTCDGTSWTTVGSDVKTNYGAGIYEAVRSMVSYNGFLYIGLGTGSAGDGDIKRCAVCDGTDWADSRADAATYEAVFSMAVYDGQLFAGMGSTANTDGDILKFSAGWQTMARRFTTAGSWAPADSTTGCTAGSVNGADDGVCLISSGIASQPSANPKVAMDDSGRAIAAFVMSSTQNDCRNSFTGSTISCQDSTLNANLFNGTWQTAIDLDPGLSSVSSASQLICFENGNGSAATRGVSSTTDACVRLEEFDLALNRTGQAALIVKTTWQAAEDWSNSCPGNGGCGTQATWGDASTTRGFPNGNADQVYIGQAIVARQFDITSAWLNTNWSLTILANFGYANGSNFSTNLWNSTTSSFVATGCPAITTIDVVRVALNCNFSTPRIALQPNGTTAIALYEQYNGTSYDIIAHQFNGTDWTTVPRVVIDGGAEEAHAPQIAMDNAGNGVAVWTQRNGGVYRAYSNIFTASSGLWGAAGNIDGPGAGVGSESGYFNPVVAMANPGGAGSAISLFLGWSVLDNTSRLYFATGP
jgi:hypothetical protein